MSTLPPPPSDDVTLEANEGKLNYRWMQWLFELYQFSTNLSTSSGSIISGGTPLTAVKTSDESVTSSTTLQDDDHLSVVLEPNRVYDFEAVIDYSSASATPDWKWLWSAADGTFNFSMTHVGNGASSHQNNNENTIALTRTLAANIIHSTTAKGTIRTGGSGGTFKLTWAQAVSNATAVTTLAGSYMRATPSI